MSPGSTITRGIKETETLREDFGQSVAQLKQVDAKLTQENKDHAQRAGVMVKEIDELRKGLIEIKMEGRSRQSKMDSSIASISDLIRQRKGPTETSMSEMRTIMAQRDRQADQRLKLNPK